MAWSAAPLLCESCHQVVLFQQMLPSKYEQNKRKRAARYPTLMPRRASMSPEPVCVSSCSTLSSTSCRYASCGARRPSLKGHCSRLR